MIRPLLSPLILAAAACLAAPAALGSVLDTRTTHAALDAQLYDAYHDRATDFVFVRLPSGWKFVGRDGAALTHEVFYDAPTGFVFVKTGRGWVFVGTEN